MTSFAEVAAWRTANLRADRMVPDRRGEPAAAAAPKGPTLTEIRMQADTEKINVDVELKKLQLAMKRGDLVSREEIRRNEAELLSRIKERLLAFPEEFETRFPAEVRAQCKEDFEQAIRHLLVEMSRWQLLDKDTADDIIVLVAEKILAARARTAAAETAAA